MDEEAFEKKLLALCKEYDSIIGHYPEHAYEGTAVWNFYRLKQMGLVDSEGHYGDLDQDYPDDEG